MRILCIGEALIDLICTDTGSSLSNGNHFLKKAGGAPTNVAAAIAAMGGDTALSAKVGADPFGKHLVEVMQHFKVDTQWVLQDPDHFTTIAFVSLMEEGQRDFYFNRGADGQLSREDVDAIDLDQFGIVHFGSATGFLPGPLQAAYQLLLQKALTKNIFVSFDPNYRQLLYQEHDKKRSFIDQSWNFIQHCHFFKLSDEEAMLLTGRNSITDAANDLLRRSTAIFAITLGKEGALLGMQGQTHHVPGITVKPIDTTGAGDAFVAAVLYQLSKLPMEQVSTLPADKWKEIISNGNKAGARACEYMGAMEAFVHLGEGLKF